MNLRHWKTIRQKNKKHIKWDEDDSYDIGEFTAQTKYISWRPSTNVLAHG